MSNQPTTTGRRGNPAELTPEQRARYDALKLEARVDVETGAVGPPADPDPAGNPFATELHGFVQELRAAREQAGLTAAEVAGRAGIAVETIARLEAGTATNPTWQVLGRYAAAVGLQLRLRATPA